MSIWKHSINLDAQEPRSPYFCPKTGRIDKAPETKKKDYERECLTASNKYISSSYGSDLSGIMCYGEICPREFWLYKAFVGFECLI